MSISSGTASDRYARLAAQVEYPESWKPGKDAAQPRTLVGDVVRWDRAQVDDYVEVGKKKDVDVLVLRDQDNKEWGIWTLQTVLRNELVGKAEPGDFVAVHYIGEGTTQEGRPVTRYRVALDKAPEESRTLEEPGDDGIPY